VSTSKDRLGQFKSGYVMSGPVISRYFSLGQVSSN
jgi:hypothetical protein